MEPGLERAWLMLLTIWDQGPRGVELLNADEESIKAPSGGEHTELHRPTLTLRDGPPSKWKLNLVYCSLPVTSVMPTSELHPPPSPPAPPTSVCSWRPGLSVQVHTGSGTFMEAGSFQSGFQSGALSVSVGKLGHRKLLGAANDLINWLWWLMTYILPRPRRSFC
ncbi:unnamed protein product [Pleuronectes platessa]|uniref:Uncharacterized protein n=1 Tax=Pleuronectes platessa TaxID=8262 RepID=A0A9N7VVT2_PLEPL|nr:unnamed protein product [Pleuronectes platessa]